MRRFFFIVVGMAFVITVSESKAQVPPDAYNKRALAVADSILIIASNNLILAERMMVSNYLITETDDSFNDTRFYVSPFTKSKQRMPAERVFAKTQFAAEQLMLKELNSRLSEFEKQKNLVFDNLYASVSKVPDNAFSMEIKEVVKDVVILYRKSFFMVCNNIVPFGLSGVGLSARLEVPALKARIEMLKIDISKQ